MCRKAMSFRKRLINSLGAAPRNWGVAPNESNNLAGRPEAFRTSGGRAARSFGVRRQSEAPTALWVSDNLVKTHPLPQVVLTSMRMVVTAMRTHIVPAKYISG